MKIDGFTLIEVIVGTVITAFILSISFSAMNHFINLYKELNYNEYICTNYRVTEIIENLIRSTSIETQSLSVTSSSNIGFKILNTCDVYLSNINNMSITNYILPFGIYGDTLYIEIPYLDNEDPIKFSNNFYLFRFVSINSKTGEQTLNYIPGNSPGSVTAPLKYSIEEVILKKISSGKFTEVKGGVLMEYTTLKGDKVSELFIRRGEL